MEKTMSDFEDLPDELSKMIILEEQTLQVAKTLATIYNGFVENGLPENVAIELTKFYIGKMMDMSMIMGNNYDE
jgi:hypothetical protein